MLTPDCHMIDRRILQQARSLIEAGHRVTLVAGGECPREEHYFIDSIAVHRYAYDWDDERIRRVRAWIPTPALRNLFTRVFRRLADRLLSFNSFDTFVYRRARALRADVVHVHDLPFLKHGARLAREWRVPLVYDAHEIYYEQESLPPARRRRLRKEEKRYAPRTDLFITVNESIAERFRRAHGDLNYLVLMNCADRVETVDRAASRQRLRAMAELATEDRIVLFQGWISAERNLDTLVRAARHFPGNTYLVFIGYGAYQAELERIVQTEGIERKVRFLGRVEPDEILPLTTGADLGVIPYLPIDLNHRYCSPNKFFEYVQARVPIVAHDLEFFRRMKDLHGVVVTGDLSSPETTADAINGLLNRPERLRELADRCERASAVLNWSSEAEKLLRAYPVSPNR
ncbi:glycosyltransferase [Candidatus Sumerlaeota bacterium]|nr:glycosyltransferase [Candidatus Sumerlaeota bacterium]